MSRYREYLESIQRTQSAAHARKVKAAQGASVEAVFTPDMPEMDKALKGLPGAIANSVMRSSVRAGGNVLKRRLMAALKKHDSDNTGTAQYQSWKTYASRERREKDLAKSIVVKVKLYEGGRTGGPRYAAFIGPERPWGNHANLLEFGGYHPLWGNREKWGYQAPTGVFRRTTLSALSEMNRAALAMAKKRAMQI